MNDNREEGLHLNGLFPYPLLPTWLGLGQKKNRAGVETTKIDERAPEKNNKMYLRHRKKKQNQMQQLRMLIFKMPYS